MQLCWACRFSPGRSPCAAIPAHFAFGFRCRLAGRSAVGPLLALGARFASFACIALRELRRLHGWRVVSVGIFLLLHLAGCPGWPCARRCRVGTPPPCGGRFSLFPSSQVVPRRRGSCAGLAVSTLRVAVFCRRVLFLLEVAFGLCSRVCGLSSHGSSKHRREESLAGFFGAPRNRGKRPRIGRFRGLGGPGPPGPP